MPQPHDVVITALGVVTPLGTGTEVFWTALCAGRSGVRRLAEYDRDGLPVCIGAPVHEFDPKQHVQPRKSLKVMAHDIQMGVAAAAQAANTAGLAGNVDAERFGVVFGSDLIQIDPAELAPVFRACVGEDGFQFSRWGEKAIPEFFPLWMLKFLPNMAACHLAILADAHGPNNTMTLGDVSSLAAIAEAASVIQRGWADVMLAGGAFSRVHPTFFIRSFNSQQSHMRERPEAACRPFDAQRDGLVNGEGGAAFVLERRAHAAARRAPILARILGWGSAFEPLRPGEPPTGDAIRRAIRAALRDAGLQPADVGHVNAHGLSTTHDDRIEAHAIRAELGDVPVVAFKSYFGHAGAASGAMELAASLLALEHGEVPPTLNYEYPDKECPINVVHGRPLRAAPGVVLKLNHNPTGQAAALLVGREA